MSEVPTSIEAFYVALKKTHLAVYSPTEDAVHTDNETHKNPLIVIGDGGGELTLLRLHHEFGTAADAGVGRKRNVTLFAEAVADAMKLSVHCDYVTRILFVEVGVALSGRCTVSALCSYIPLRRCV